jgi:hypothetical protein
MKIEKIEIFNPEPIAIKSANGETIAEIKKIPAMVNVIFFKNEKLFSAVLNIAGMNATEVSKVLADVYEQYQSEIEKIIALSIGKDAAFVRENFGFYDIMMTLTVIVSQIVEESTSKISKKKELSGKAAV